MPETAKPAPQRHQWLIGSLGLLCGALLLLAGHFVYRAQPKAQRSGGGRHSLLVPAARTIAPGLHILGGLKPSAAYVVETKEGLVLIDSGLRRDASPLESQMAELGLDGRAVRAILLTHAHGDHSGGAQSLRERTGAKVYAGAGDASVLRAGEPREAFFSTFPMPNDTPHPTTVDVELHGGESLAFGEVRFRAIATPGHTPGSVCYLMERAGLRALFAGDVITMLLGRSKRRGDVGRPLGTYSAYLAPRYRGNAKDYLASLRELRALPVPDLVLSGHPGADPMPQSPVLSQRRWEALLDDGIHEMETLVARYEADGADFLDGVPKAVLPGLDYLGEFGGVAVYGVFPGSKFYLVNAPGGTGLVAFVKSRLRQLGREPAEPTAVWLTSGEPEARAGLRELVETCHVRVVAPAASVEALRDSCPPGTVVLAPAELTARAGFPIRPIPLNGRGSAPIAYQIEWAGKTVLFSGRIPIKITPESVAALVSDIGTSKARLQEYADSLETLRGLAPQLWLPATPIDGQNANLYDDDWEHVLDENREVTRFTLSRARLD
jgi:glyoxylase-like metal-dependent hydrolase (beta-lactamase superfamily II)